MHMAKRPLFYLLVIFLLSACAVSQDEIPIPSEPIGAMSVVTTSESIYADGNTSATVRVILSLENDDPYPDYPINFNTSLGSLSKTQVVTDEFGIAEVTLTSITLGTAKVTIIAGSYTETITINVIASETQAATPSYVSLATEKPIILTNNTETTEITATMLDVNYGVVPGVQVSFAATGGQLSATQVVTDEKGEAVVTFSSGALDASNRVETITVKAGSLSKQIPVQITGTEIQLVSVDKSLILGGTNAQATTT
ncbi:MAG: Ig-like domain-containing protein, partial [Gammaproteobacteria bacterium]|nr:Ig-like domain-containing protein [Gammaproteobacteria bacterium]